MREDLVSTIIPCYNQARYLGEALESVFKQTYPLIEVIVINDGSTDDIEGALTLYRGRPRLQVLHQENQGLANARNRGISVAQGAYVQFLDADDWLHPEKITQQVAILAANPDVGLVYSDYYLVYNDVDLSVEDTVAARCADPYNPDLFLTWWIQGVFPPCAALVRTAWIQRAGPFNPSLPAYEDYELWLRMSALGLRARYLPERLAYYRQHAESLTTDTASMQMGLQIARSEVARQFPQKIGQAMDYLDASYYRLEMQLRKEIEALRAENAALRNTTAPFNEGGNRIPLS